MKIKLTKEQEEFLNTGHTFDDGDHTYYRLPHYYRKIGDGLFEIISIGKLPKKAYEHLVSQRGRVPDTSDFKYPPTPDKMTKDEEE